MVVVKDQEASIKNQAEGDLPLPAKFSCTETTMGGPLMAIFYSSPCIAIRGEDQAMRSDITIPLLI
jgi:hypothetical protein